MARCPRCRGQLFGCGCPFDEFAGEEDEDGERYDESPTEHVRPFVSLAFENPCPVCGSEAVIPILYGRPNPATEALSAQGLVELAAGQFDGAQPSSRCRTCEHAWTRRAGDVPRLLDEGRGEPPL